MNPADFEQLQKDEREKELQDLRYVKISNSLLECFIQKRNIIAIKIVFYLAIKQNSVAVKSFGEHSFIDISLRDLSNVINTDRKTIIKNIKQMQQTSITFVSKKDKQPSLVTYMSVVPLFEYETGKDNIRLMIFNQVLDLMYDVKNRFTVINVENVIQLKSINTIKMIGLLKMIDNYSTGVAKKKVYTLEVLNQLFGVNYKNYYEFERKVLKPVKEELDQESQLTFFYDFNFEVVGRGRPPIKEVVIYLKDNKNRQLTMF